MENSESTPESIARGLSEAPTLDSAVYGHTFFGILNADGAFWTPLVFDQERKAWDHLRDWWSLEPAKAEEVIAKFRVVPVRVRLEALLERSQND